MNKYYEIKVTIRGSHPPTWRRLRIPANITFNELASIIEIAFEWCGYHLYEFEVGATLHEMGTFISIPSEEDWDIDSIRGETLDSNKEKISKYFNKYKRLKFIYDFGDDWVHDIIIEKEVNEELENPICIKARMGAYPEDCGGVYGYEEYYEDKEERLEPDIETINYDLEDYKDFAEQIYNREMF